ncbi:MAG TPA: type VI secretion system contractile sheath large subunit [Acetobacteraceae bacterium]|nr:type VI secretion system contractile sheath large subunit [Acetobacteraceae bacterium]
MNDAIFADLLKREVVPEERRLPEQVAPALTALAARLGVVLGDNPRHAIEAMIAEIDRAMSQLINLILHHPDFQQLESVWRGLFFAVQGIETGPSLKVKAIDISKRELVRTLRKFRGTAWDQSPLFRKVYEEEYGQFGGEPFAVLIGGYEFDHSPPDVQLLNDLAQIAAAAHAPFIAAASPSVMQMDSWNELANPRNLTAIFQTPEYAPWRSLRASEDARYLGLCLPRFLARLPYGSRTEPVEAFEFEEEVDGPDASRFLWGNPAFAMGANIARAFYLYGWCVRIRGIDGGGVVEDLPSYHFPTADGDVDLRCSTEVALSERRESELAMNGFIPLVHRKNADYPAFIGAPSLQKPREYDDPSATMNAALSARLPYMFATSRFAHYLKCMVRDKVGSTSSRAQLNRWLEDWIDQYIDGSPDTSSDEWKASHPLAQAEVHVEASDDAPGKYEAKFFLRPHYQLEGVTAMVRLVSRLASP